MDKFIIRFELGPKQIFHTLGYLKTRTQREVPVVVMVDTKFLVLVQV